MGFINADQFFSNLAIYRLLWLRGRLGGGKTLLAMAIAQEMIDRKIVDGVIANVPHGLKLHPWREKLMNGACIIFDEAWTILDNRTSISNSRAYGAFARKLESYWLFPSVIPIDKRASYLYVERTARLSIPFLTLLIALLCKIPVLGLLFSPIKWLGEEFWVYKFGVNLGYTKDEGWFILTEPSRYYGMYDTKYIPLDDAGIAKLWERTIYERTKDDPSDEQEWYEETHVHEGLSTEATGRDPSKVRDVAQQLSFAGSNVEDGESIY